MININIPSLAIIGGSSVGKTTFIELLQKKYKELTGFSLNYVNLEVFCKNLLLESSDESLKCQQKLVDVLGHQYFPIGWSYIDYVKLILSSSDKLHTAQLIISNYLIDYIDEAAVQMYLTPQRIAIFEVNVLLEWRLKDVFNNKILIRSSYNDCKARLKDNKSWNDNKIDVFFEAQIGDIERIYNTKYVVTIDNTDTLYNLNQKAIEYIKVLIGRYPPYQV
jgi:dephospho-CoA kinase